MQPILVLYKAPFRSNFQKQWFMEGAGPLRIPITWYFEVTVSEWDSAKKILLWLTQTIISNQKLGFKRIFSSLSNLVSNSSVLVKSPFLQNLCMLIGAHLWVHACLSTLAARSAKEYLVSRLARWLLVSPLECPKDKFEANVSFLFFATF